MSMFLINFMSAGNHQSRHRIKMNYFHICCIHQYFIHGQILSTFMEFMHVSQEFRRYYNIHKILKQMSKVSLKS